MADAKRATVFCAADVHQALRRKAPAAERSTGERVNEAVNTAPTEDVEDRSALPQRQTEHSAAFVSLVHDLRQRGGIKAAHHRGWLFVVWAGAYGLAGLAEADVFKCLGPDGKMTYQDSPCAQGSNGTTIRAPGAAAPAGARPQPADPGVRPAQGSGTAAPNPTPAPGGAQPPRAVPPIDLDAGAYRALAAGNQADLAGWRSKGGDAARYAKNNPEAIYDATRSDRDVAVLEFVLKNGANPNAQIRPGVKGGPIFVNPFDCDKVALLVKYGADVNVRDLNGYAPLSHALFAPASEFKMPPDARAGQKVRVFTKLEVVRLLLDSGAEFNGPLGGEGDAGTLGLTRRVDPDVIRLLVARGATLRYPANRSKAGPITTAIQQDRDDLALALLGRDKRLGADDNLALLEATRRGFSEVALALLHANADPNVADAKGATALTWALRRKDAPLIAALQQAGANQPAAPLKARSLATASFDARTASKIDEVALFDPDRFYLASSLPKPEVVFLFYGAEPGQFETFKCEDAALFSLIAYANKQGTIQVGICRNEARRVRGAARSAKDALAQVTSSLGASAPKPDQLKAAGLDWDSATYADGWEGYRFPLVAIGHGIAVVNTVVLSSQAEGRAVIVQADLGQLCDSHYGQGRQVKTPLCEDTAKALTDIALSVARTP
jgi:ankyrin repeat protein